MINNIEIDGKTYDINDRRVDEIDEVVLVDPSTLTVEEFHTLSEKFLNGNVTILLKVESSTRVMVHTVEYEGTGEYGRWGASALTTSATDDVDFSFAEFDLYNIRYNPYDNAVYFEKETRDYPKPKLYVHSLQANGASEYPIWGGFSFYSTKNTPITDMQSLVLYKDEIENGAIINYLAKDMSGMSDVYRFSQLYFRYGSTYGWTLMGKTHGEFMETPSEPGNSLIYNTEELNANFTHTVKEV